MVYWRRKDTIFCLYGMKPIESLQDSHSRMVLDQIDRAVEWVPESPPSEKYKTQRAVFAIDDLLPAIGLPTGVTKRQFGAQLANRERMGPSWIQKKETRNEIALILGRGMSDERIVLHFPYSDQWFPSVVYSDGSVSNLLSSHEDGYGSHWTVKGVYVADLKAAVTSSHGLQVVYDWNRELQLLTLVRTRVHQFGEIESEDPVAYTPQAIYRHVQVDRVGDFAVPGQITEADFVRNLIFPWRPLQFDFQRDTFRQWGSDDVFGLKYMPRVSDEGE
jgi:hypothetical protein